MPIAQCFVTSDLIGNGGDLIELWSSTSGISKEHMTINLIAVQQQFGVRYPIMAQLQLPDIWSREQSQALQEGLSKALADFFQQPLSAIHLITSQVATGMVVEDGKTIHW